MSIEYDDIETALVRTGSVSAAAKALGVPRGTIRAKLAEWKTSEILHKWSDTELVEQNVRAKKQAQKYQDLNRVERKSFREFARIENAVVQYAKAIRSLLKSKRFMTPPRSRVHTEQPGAIIHWSDQHLNERVSLPHNSYDWKVAAQRLRKHVHETIKVLKAYDVQHVLVAMTGDLLNSDRRLDELLANAGNRAKASVLAVDLYQQALRELNDHFEVTVGSVSGNESRIPKELGWQAEVASDNYDFTIHEHLSLLLADTGIHFFPVNDPNEMVIEVAGQNCLFLHGHGSIARGDIQKSVQAAKGRWLERGVQVDLMFWGHIHEALVADIYARSSSLVGSNDFAEKALNYTGRASQNTYIVLPGGGFHGVKIDLQDTDGVEGYQIDGRLEAYNTKSADKVKPKETVMRVVI